jgi:hypothetical protein
MTWAGQAETQVPQPLQRAARMWLTFWSVASYSMALYGHIVVADHGSRSSSPRRSWRRRARSSTVPRVIMFGDARGRGGALRDRGRECPSGPGRRRRRRRRRSWSRPGSSFGMALGEEAGHRCRRCPHLRPTSRASACGSSRAHQDDHVDREPLSGDRCSVSSAWTMSLPRSVSDRAAPVTSVTSATRPKLEVHALSRAAAGRTPRSPSWFVRMSM